MSSNHEKKIAGFVKAIIEFFLATPLNPDKSLLGMSCSSLTSSFGRASVKLRIMYLVFNAVQALSNQFDYTIAFPPPIL